MTNYDKAALDEALRQARELKDLKEQPCMHNSCPSCSGTGARADGTACIHMMSCPCPKCSPRMYRM